MVNIYDTANQLQADLRQIKEYKELAKKMHEIGQKAASFDAVKRLMEKERALSVVVDDIEQALFKPITELYES